jgi:signal peptidase I
MIPTLLVGDYVLISKSAFGLRLASGARILTGDEPRHGDIVLFRYPGNRELPYLKRVVGVPGDRVAYNDKELTINNQKVPLVEQGDYQFTEGGLNPITARRLREDLGSQPHSVLIMADAAPVQLNTVRAFPHRDACQYDEHGFVCTVPPGHYFVMGDNRDSSSDSRYWGFVPEGDILGRALIVFSSTGKPQRIGLRPE